MNPKLVCRALKGPQNTKQYIQTLTEMFNVQFLYIKKFGNKFVVLNLLVCFLLCRSAVIPVVHFKIQNVLICILFFIRLCLDVYEALLKGLKKILRSLLLSI